MVIGITVKSYVEAKRSITDRQRRWIAGVERANQASGTPSTFDLLVDASPRGRSANGLREGNWDEVEQVGSGSPITRYAAVREMVSHARGALTPQVLA